MAEQQGGTILQFVPFVSRLETGFWHELGRRKLEKYKLSEEQQDIHGCYYNTSVPGLPMHMTLEYSAFEEEERKSYAFQAPGFLLNKNTIDSFKTADKKKLIEGVATKIWDSITSGAAINDPSLLSRFLLLTFANLKKFDYYFWFAFPALLPDTPFSYNSLSTLDKVWTKEKISTLKKAYDGFHGDNPGVGYFLVSIGEESGGGAISLHHLKDFDAIHSKGGKVMLGYADPSTFEANPGWPLRNFLMLAAQQWGEKLGGAVDVLCYRDYTREGKRVNTHSLIITGVKLPAKTPTDGLPKCVGWEKNEKDKLVPKVVNLSSSMDPVRLAESSVDLNLKLMRWRLLPSLDLEAISSTKCLLLGSGTLGCNVARCLLGWGVRCITMVDNSTVSYSNPVRQSLFQFKDCVGGGRHKAEAAAETLRLIFPGVQAEAVDLSIPMPGHSVGSTDKAISKARKDVESLEKLIKDHDVVFLLMDTRESRWLPTLLCCAHSKICINAALGFDTFMVMRHGYRSLTAVANSVPPTPAHSSRIPGGELGCYFCSDVVAPTDSTRDRTLDQQCTVSRPGVSMIASALAVELLMSVLQHQDRGLAISETFTEEEDPENESVLGIVPHQIRGFLSRFHDVLPASQRFDKCTACSDTVLQCYEKEGFDFLLKAFNSPNYLEDLTGLSQLYAQTLDDQVWDLSDEEFDD